MQRTEEGLAERGAMLQTAYAELKSWAGALEQWRVELSQRGA